MKDFTPWQLARRGLRGHRRAHAAIAAGVAVATAVLVGALVVGDSVRGSLRDLTLQRLGDIDYAVAPGSTFREALADEIEADAAPLLLVPATLSHRINDQTRRAGRLNLIGCDRRFFAMDSGQEARGWPPFDGGLFLTRSIANELGVAVGDSVLVTSSIVTALPADSALGEKSETVASVRLEVSEIIPPEGLARFALAPSQGEPRNAFAPLAVVQQLIQREGESNALVVDAEASPSVSPRLADYGLTFDQPRPGVWQLESRELVTRQPIVEAARRAWGSRPNAAVNTYLANTIRRGKKSIPYSTVAGVESTHGLSPTQELADDQIVLNRWAADDLDATVGDEITLTYYEPESTHGVLREAEPVTLKLAGIVDLLDADGESTGAGDPRWTPQLEGVTDAESINDWDLPFELVETIRDADEDYWDEHSTTPKAFVSLAISRRLWGSRWGDTSSIRVADPNATEDQLAALLLSEIDPESLGFAPIAIREQGLAASSGSTPFDVLFLLFSLFLIGSALLLIVLLVWLAVDERRRELGVLGAIGFDRKAVRRGLLREFGPVAGFGAALGAAIGVAYAAGLLYLLRTVWIDAIGAPFLRLHVGPLAVVGGLIGAWLVAMAAIAWAVRNATKAPPKALLAGSTPPSPSETRQATWPTGLALASVTGAGILTMLGGTLRGEAAAGAFFGAGGLALTALLAFVYRLGQGGRRSAGGGLSLSRLAGQNIRRRPGRSLLTIGLVAAASFLLLATSAFRLPPTESGTGGFDLIAQSDQPLHYDLATPEGRWELGFGPKQEQPLEKARVFGFRVHAGEDASCRNLYQTKQPRVLGVSDRFIAAADETPTPFNWAESVASKGESPWSSLTPADDDAVPVVLDFNTAVYSMKLYGGVGSRFEILDEAGQPIEVVLAGLLKNSVLQGDLLMSEASFLRLFPSAAGHAFYLIDSSEDQGGVAAVLEETLSDYGFDTEDAAARLAGYLAVQNTYLSTFQSLGALGLLLGAIGLAVAQFRNLLERRGELALMRAGGFPKTRLRRLVLVENLALLAAGLVIGAIAATATLAPLSATSDAQPPWLVACGLLAATLLIGLAAARLAAGRALAAPITAALRGE